MPESTERGALTEAVFYILLSLVEPLHGYGIMQNISKLSRGRVSLGAGTLYGALNTLIDKDYIIMCTEIGRKKEYKITDNGIEVLKAELERLQELIENGKTILGGEKSDA